MVRALQRGIERDGPRRRLTPAPAARVWRRPVRARKRASRRSMPPSMEKSWRRRVIGRAPRAARRSGSRARRLMRVRQRLPIARRRRARPRRPSRMNSGMPAKSRRDDGEPLACRLHAARSAGRPGRPMPRPSPAARRGPPRAGARSISGCGLAPRNATLSADARRPAPAPSGRCSSSPPPTWAKRQCRSAGSAARRRSRSSKPFFATARPTETMRTGSAGSEPSRAGRRSGGGGKAGEVEAVIDERHPLRAGASAPQMAARLARVQVTPQSASASFSRFSQSGVVQMSLAWAEKVQVRPVSSAGVAHDRGRRVQIMDVQMRRRPPAARAPGRRPGRAAGRGSASGRASGRARTARSRCAEARLPQAPEAARAAPAAAPGRDIPAGSATRARMRRCIGCTAVSVGWRSDQISSATPRCSSARISCAMKVSDRRG